MGKIMYKGENFPGGPNLLSELRDVNFSNVQDKQIILYDSTSRTWKNHTITAADVAYDANNSVEDVIDSLNSAIDTKANKPTSYSVGTVNIQASTYTTIDIPYTDIPATSKCLTPYFASYPDSSLLSMTFRIIRTNNAWRIAVYNTATRAVSVGITVDYIPV